MWLKVWQWFKLVREDLAILFFAWRNPATPRYIRWMLVALVGYLVSPVDFVPDYLPIIGLADDALIVPAAVYYIVNLLPPGVRWECGQKALAAKRWMPYILFGVTLCMVLWLAFLAWAVYKLLI